MQPVIPPPAAWTKNAACVGMVGGDFDPWHPLDGVQGARRRDLIDDARAICLACPVSVECGRYALEQLNVDVVHGMYAGMTPDELRALARSLGRSTRRVAQHGTRTRYINERCRCADCAEANASYESRRRGNGPLCAAIRCRQPAAIGSEWCTEHRSLRVA